MGKIPTVEEAVASAAERHDSETVRSAYVVSKATQLVHASSVGDHAHQATVQEGSGRAGLAGPILESVLAQALALDASLEIAGATLEEVGVEIPPLLARIAKGLEGYLKPSAVDKAVGPAAEVAAQPVVADAATDAPVALKSRTRG